MSYAIIEVIYGVPLTEEVSEKIKEWEDDGDDERYWESNETVCGFTTRYSASGDGLIGFCGVVVAALPTYEPSKLSDLKLPSPAQIAKATELIAALHPELRELAGPIDTYFIWSDS